MTTNPRRGGKSATALQKAFFTKAGPGIRLLKEVMDAVPTVAFYLKDADDRIMALNPRNCEICNVPNEAAALGKRSSDILPLPLAETYMARDRLVRETRTPLLGVLNMKTADRTAHPRRVSTFPVFDGHGHVLGTASVICSDTRDAETSPRDDWARLQPAIRHLETAYAEPTPVSVCAQLAHMSETNFRRCFKRTLGCTPLEFLMSLRLAAARRLLATTDRSISDIALASGFCDHAHFIHAFRAHRKMTPGEYRRRKRASVSAQPSRPRAQTRPNP